MGKYNKDKHEIQNMKKDPQKQHRLRMAELSMLSGTNLTLNSDVDQDT